ncbi:MAG TPA: LLM class flavin-dependent oxidoreductase [Ilumatobacteraceae bacterium]|jgi:alkanesulfonate monooxygenase SsuD/methylene tetrahydromethanopterin reductase-like flavin-dependent oxidoreductase (luciferase family)
MTTFGVMFRREWPAQELMGYARRVEDGGLDELWVVEDLGFHGGFTQATAALAATSQISVGIGIAPAVVRNVAYTAMEIATLAQMFPGRFHMGFGHGVDFWIEQVGAAPSSWLAALGEVVIATTGLLAGDTVTMDGRHVHLDGVHLEHPAAVMPAISLGVRGPKSMALAADVADGVIFAEWSGPRYLQQVRDQIGDGTSFTAFVQASADVAALEAMMGEKMALPRFAAQLAAYGSEQPPLEELVVAGDPATWFDQAQKWVDAGASAVVFCPLPSDPVEVPL